jgi:hypothetical protein
LAMVLVLWECTEVCFKMMRSYGAVLLPG